MRDSCTHQELADKEFRTATCGNVVGAPWPCSPTTGSASNFVRPVRANHVDLDVAPVARHDIVEVLLVCEGQSGEVTHRTALTALGPVPDAARLVTVVQQMNDSR